MVILAKDARELWVSKSDSISDKPINLGDDVGFTVLERSFIDVETGKPHVEKYLKERVMTDGFWEILQADRWFSQWEREHGQHDWVPPFKY